MSRAKRSVKSVEPGKYDTFDKSFRIATVLVVVVYLAVGGFTSIDLPVYTTKTIIKDHEVNTSHISKKWQSIRTIPPSSFEMKSLDGKDKKVITMQSYGYCSGVINYEIAAEGVNAFHSSFLEEITVKKCLINITETLQY